MLKLILASSDSDEEDKKVSQNWHLMHLKVLHLDELVAAIRANVKLKGVIWS
jgi:hypothetical protein